MPSRLFITLPVKLLQVGNLLAVHYSEHSEHDTRNTTPTTENAAIVKPNGDVMKAEANYNQIVFTGLGINDKIVMTYKLKSYYDGSLSEHFWDTQYFQYYVPVKETRYSIH